MDRDIDCTVNGSRCSNRSGMSDDDWSGTLAAGTHSVRVYPYRGGTGAWTILAVVNCPAGHLASGGACYRYVVSSDRPSGPTPALGSGPDGLLTLTCDGNTELAAGAECQDGFVVFSGGKIDVTSTPIPIPRIPITISPPPPLPPPPVTPPPPPPPPPSGPTPLMRQQLATAVADALAKSRTCSVTLGRFTYNANAALTAAQAARKIVHGGPLCADTRRPNAHVDSIPGTTIFVCLPFYAQSVPDRSLTIMHEGCIWWVFAIPTFLARRAEAIPVR